MPRTNRKKEIKMNFINLMKFNQVKCVGNKFLFWMSVAFVSRLLLLHGIILMCRTKGALWKEKVRQKNHYSGCGKHLDSVGVKMWKKYHICVAKNWLIKLTCCIWCLNTTSFIVAVFVWRLFCNVLKTYPFCRPASDASQCM